MASIDLERFRAGYVRNAKAIGRGDINAAFAWVPPEFEWHVMEELGARASRLDFPSVLRGRDEVEAFFADMREEWGWALEPIDFAVEGDTSVVVRAVGVLTGRASGLRSEIRFTQVWELDDSGTPVRVRERLDDAFVQGLGPG